jgi:hypothetical protein
MCHFFWVVSMDMFVKFKILVLGSVPFFHWLFWPLRHGTQKILCVKKPNW